jgi:hypothetical protein
LSSHARPTDCVSNDIIDGTRECKASPEVPFTTSTQSKSENNDLQSKCDESPPSKPDDHDLQSAQRKRHINAVEITTKSKPNTTVSRQIFEMLPWMDWCEIP